MFMSNPEHFLIIAKPMRPVPMIATVLPVTSSPRNGRNGCHDGHFCSRTNRSLCHIFRASIPIMKNANSAVASVAACHSSLRAPSSSLQGPSSWLQVLFRPSADAIERLRPRELELSMKLVVGHLQQLGAASWKHVTRHLADRHYN